MRRFLEKDWGLYPTLVCRYALRHKRFATMELPTIPDGAINPTDNCPVCTEPNKHMVMLPCRRCFCHECLQAVLGMDNCRCPLCRVNLTTAQVLTSRHACCAVRNSLKIEERYAYVGECTNSGALIKALQMSRRATAFPEARCFKFEEVVEGRLIALLGSTMQLCTAHHHAEPSTSNLRKHFRKVRIYS